MSQVCRVRIITESLTPSAKNSLEALAGTLSFDVFLPAEPSESGPLSMADIDVLVGALRFFAASSGSIDVSWADSNAVDDPQGATLRAVSLPLSVACSLLALSIGADQAALRSGGLSKGLAIARLGLPEAIESLRRVSFEAALTKARGKAGADHLEALRNAVASIRRSVHAHAAILVMSGHNESDLAKLAGNVRAGESIESLAQLVSKEGQEDVISAQRSFGSNMTAWMPRSRLSLSSLPVRDCTVSGDLSKPPVGSGTSGLSKIRPTAGLDQDAPPSGRLIVIQAPKNVVNRLLVSNFLLLGTPTETPSDFVARSKKRLMDRGFFEFAIEAPEDSQETTPELLFESLLSLGVLEGPKARFYEVGFVDRSSDIKGASPMTVPLISRWEVKGSVCRRVDAPPNVLVMKLRKELPKTSAILSSVHAAAAPIHLPSSGKPRN